MATDKLGEEDKQTFLQGQDHVLFSQLSEEQRQAIPRLVQSGRVTVDYLAKDKQNIKTEKHYSVQKVFSRLWLFRKGLRNDWSCETSC